MYIILCIAGGCNDYAPRNSWNFKSQRECTVFVGKAYISVVKKLREKGIVVLDGKAFCLRFTETKKI